MFHIGVFGAAIVERQDLVPLAREIGRVLAAAEAIVITGACSGLPYQAAHAAAELGADVWGFSPVRSIEEQRRFTPQDDLSIYSRLIYPPDSFPFADDPLVCKKYRNVISTAHCDAGIIISGRWGTLNEFTNLVDFGKITGVLTNTGAIADELPGLTGRIRKEPSSTVIFDHEPQRLVERVLAALTGASA